MKRLFLSIVLTLLLSSCSNSSLEDGRIFFHPTSTDNLDVYYYDESESVIVTYEKNEVTNSIEFTISIGNEEIYYPESTRFMSNLLKGIDVSDIVINELSIYVYDANNSDVCSVYGIEATITDNNGFSQTMRYNVIQGEDKEAFCITDEGVYGWEDN